MVVVQVLSSFLARLEAAPTRTETLWERLPAAKINSELLFTTNLFDSIKQLHGQFLCRPLISGFAHAGQIRAVGKYNLIGIQNMNHLGRFDCQIGSNRFAAECHQKIPVT